MTCLLGDANASVNQLGRWLEDCLESLMDLFPLDVSGALTTSQARIDGFPSLASRAIPHPYNSTASFRGRQAEQYPMRRPSRGEYPCFSVSQGCQSSGCHSSSATPAYLSAPHNGDSGNKNLHACLSADFNLFRHCPLSDGTFQDLNWLVDLSFCSKCIHIPTLLVAISTDAAKLG